MWKKLNDKLFCRHVWKTHAKNMYPNVMLNGNRNEQTTEILICENCGKIKQIMY